ncbi:hypothetical protein PENTCL1PPCAC_4819 [Pristionchus entomophagus]|uniref:Uncharacterized protein n=1 Tax=Pristionchus entomophagus TaxID=358040 RepID=A0AAV5SKI1_9BILA|nr:hypothetical protein PENTCL1PPCAC_4819 [Pristionchus entomophagus]
MSRLAPSHTDPLPSCPTLASLLRAALAASSSRALPPVRASAVASGGISRVSVQSSREVCDPAIINIPTADNRGSAKRDAKFVGDEIRRLLESRAVEICPAPRVISPLSIAQGDPASLLSRALLHSIAEAQKTFSSPSAPIPLSPDERGEVDQWLRENAKERLDIKREKCVFPGAKSTLLQCLASTVTRAELALLPVLLEAISGSKAEATMKSYRASMKNLRLYAKDRGLDPACPSTLLIYTLMKIEEGRALSTLKIVSSAFSHFADPLSQTHSHILSYLQDSTRRKCESPIITPSTPLLLIHLYSIHLPIHLIPTPFVSP